MYRDVTVKDLFTDYYLASGVTITSDPVDIGAHVANGNFSLQFYIQGSGTSVVAEYTLSNDSVNYVQSSDGHTIATGLSSVSGLGANGRDLVSFSPPLAARMKILFWLSAGTGSTITARLALI